MAVRTGRIRGTPDEILQEGVGLALSALPRSLRPPGWSGHRMNAFPGLVAGELDSRGARWTAEEIAQQPAVWCAVGELVTRERGRLDAFLQPLLENPRLRVVLTGAGTSAFIGDCLAPRVVGASRSAGRGDRDDGTPERPATAPAVGWPDAARLFCAFRQQSGERGGRRARGAVPARPRVSSRHHVQRRRRAGSADAGACERLRDPDAGGGARSWFRDDVELQRHVPRRGDGFSPGRRRRGRPARPGGRGPAAARSTRWRSAS